MMSCMSEDGHSVAFRLKATQNSHQVNQEGLSESQLEELNDLLM